MSNDEDETRKNWQKMQAKFLATGKEVFVEKTPLHIRRLHVIRRFVPCAQFLIMVRDPRDVAASFVKRGFSAESGLQRWVRDSRETLRHGAEDHVFIQRYEDLVSDVQGSIRQICEFFGLEFEEEMLRHHEVKEKWFGVPDMEKGSGKDGVQHRRLRNWQIHQPVFDGRGKWKGSLTEKELAVFSSKKVLDLAAQFGYKL